MKSGKHKKRINYTVMIVSDSLEGGHSFYLKQGLVTVILCLVAVVVAVSVGVALYHGTALRGIQTREAELQKQIEQLTEENQRLTTDNSELSDKVTILSDTVAQNAETQKKQEQEEEEKKIPKGFPLAGPAVILASSETDMLQGAEEAADGAEAATPEMEPIVVFSASAGTKVIATATGTVASVEDDAAYGHRITVDHGNGYTSVYRAASEPTVSEGEEVETGGTLYEMQFQDERLGYQITQDGTLIDPLDLLEVYG